MYNKLHLHIFLVEENSGGESRKEGENGGHFNTTWANHTENGNTNGQNARTDDILYILYA